MRRSPRSRRRYFAGHGPALAQDFAWWAGLTVADAKAAIEMIERGLESEVVDGKTYWFAPHGRVASVPDPTVHLLPNYDEYLIAYKDHSASLDVRLPSGSGAMYEMLSRHIVVLNGRVIGGWKNVAEKKGVAVEAKLIVPLDPAQKHALPPPPSATARSSAGRSPCERAARASGHPERGAIVRRRRKI